MSRRNDMRLLLLLLQPLLLLLLLLLLVVVAVLLLVPMIVRLPLLVYAIAPLLLVAFRYSLDILTLLNGPIPYPDVGPFYVGQPIALFVLCEYCSHPRQVYYVTIYHIITHLERNSRKVSLSTRPSNSPSATRVPGGASLDVP